MPGLRYIPTLFYSVLLTACTSLPAEQGVAMHDWQPLTFDNEAFAISGWLKSGQDAPSVLRIYIEGDGFAWAFADQPSDDPTPANGVGRQLALADRTLNVVYLGRPCQYAARRHHGCEDRRWWTSYRYHRQVVAQYHAILDGLQQGGQPLAFELVGYSGGAAIAVILAAERHDVSNVRTVAGNLDSAFLNQYHHASPMPESLNPLAFASQLRQPQLHFTGRQDRIVPQEVSRRFMQMQPAGCSAQVALDATHWLGWQAAWPALLNTPWPSCQHPAN